VNRPWIGHKFEARCLDCGQTGDVSVFGMDLGGRPAAAREERNQWMHDNHAATGHIMFEMVNSQYHRVELLVPRQARLLDESEILRRELEP